MDYEVDTNVNKSNKGLYAIIGILCVLVLALGGFVVYDKFIKEDKKETTNTNTNTECNCTKCDVKDQTTAFDLSKFDTSKAINGSDNTAYTLYQQYEFGPISAKWDGGKKVHITLDCDALKETLGVTAKYPKEEYDVSFSKSIKGIYVLGFGQSFGDETLYALMEDGTLEYVPIGQVLMKAKSFDVTFENKGAVSTVKDVVAIAQVNASPTCKNCLGGYMDAVAIKSDGTFYVLGNLLDK